MNNIKKKAVAVLGAATILGTSVFTGVMAAGTDVVGKIANMKIFNNGAAISVPSDQQPIIVNNRTYLPVRALGEALGKQVSWSQNDPNSVYISAGANEQQYSQLALDLNQAKIQIVEKEAKIKELEAKVKNLEEELKKKEDSVTGLTAFEKDLNKYYGDYEKLRVDITLREKSSSIVVDIDINKSYYTAWDKLSYTKQERLISDIVSDIQKEYKYPKVEGTLSAGTKASSYDFYTDSKDKLQIDVQSGSGSSSRGDYASLERYIISEYSEVYDASITEYDYNIVADIELKSNRYTTDELYDLRTDIGYDIDVDLNRSAKYKIYVDFYYNGKLVDQDR
ncbi:hypothetical protein KQI38_13890 [Tissierella carlieri]|uniref:stalk domain-containing protein n=1 Tax=Tissierella carlieri TaxID=689904 RepID=UPI001C126656|nr:stalk domain-containing protein [Tissierella carlieri]MBU5313131.1 hypothetical protein [Tissierella carlieri]